MPFNEILDNSQAVQRFAKIEGMDSDQLYEFFFECFCGYMDMFKERLSYGREINRIMSSYRAIDAFKVLTPRELIKRLFNSCHVHIWFAYRFWAEADKQIANKRVNRDELQLTLTFMGAIPTTKLMEEILNEYRNRDECAPGIEARRAGSAAKRAEVTA